MKSIISFTLKQRMSQDGEKDYWKPQGHGNGGQLRRLII